MDEIHLNVLEGIASNLTRDNIGESMERAIVIQAVMADFVNKSIAEKTLNVIRAYARNAEIGWRIYSEPLKLEKLTDNQVWQFIGIVGSLQELEYCFERIEEARFFTFDNSAPVRFYVNGIFHYVTSLFLLNWDENNKKGLPYPGTIITVLFPIRLSRLLEPIYQVLNRPFGLESSYGETIRKTEINNLFMGHFPQKIYNP